MLSLEVLAHFRETIAEGLVELRPFGSALRLREHCLDLIQRLAKPRARLGVHRLRTLELFVKLDERFLQLLASIRHVAHGSTEPTPRIKVPETRAALASGATLRSERLAYAIR